MHCVDEAIFKAFVRVLVHGEETYFCASLQQPGRILILLFTRNNEKEGGMLCRDGERFLRLAGETNLVTFSFIAPSPRSVTVSSEKVTVDILL